MPFLYDVGLKGREALTISMQANAQLAALNQCTMIVKPIIMGTMSDTGPVRSSSLPLPSDITMIGDGDLIPTAYSSLDVASITMALETTVVSNPTNSSLNISSSLTMSAEVL